MALRKPLLAAALAAAAAGVSPGEGYFDEEPEGGAMQLRLMTDKGLAGMGAVCLDGSDAGFYFSPASRKEDANNWQIYFQGGGWCYSEMDCWGRSNMVLGSSRRWRKYATMGGIMSDDCSANPDFCGFNKVFMGYCDGFSFGGDRAEPLNVTGMDGKDKLLYFRGKRIIDAALQTLNTMGMDKAEKVLLTGCSAGGLATFLHTDYVWNSLKQTAPSMKTFKSVPLSGFFLAHNNLNGEPVYIEEMKEAFALSNVSASLSPRCLASKPEAEQWRCAFAAGAYAFIEAPVFPVNSALDSWQTRCIFSSEPVPGFPHPKMTRNGECNAIKDWTNCMNDVEQCNSTQMEALNQYTDDFEQDFRAAPTFQKAGNGAFVHSCYTHCEAQDTRLWNGFVVQGKSIREAVSEWWRSDNAPPSQHSYDDCMYHADQKPHSCNPTCRHPREPQKELHI